jgi:shikimate dehydrogenase
MSYELDTYAVFGNPIGHSKSPLIHAEFARQTGQILRYLALLAPLDGFAHSLREFQDKGGKGCNITLPFKQQAWALADERSELAEQAGAVNTLVFQPDGRRYGHNTDGLGLLVDLTQNIGWEPRGKHILILGAGGAARGVLGALLGQGPARLVIANRTLAKAEELARLFASPATPVSACGYPELRDDAFDLVLNATSAGVQNEIPPLPDTLLRHGALAYDMFYGARPTAFVEWAKRHDAGYAIDGLGMLVEQAAAAFALWRGVRPETRPAVRLVREQIAHAG